MRNIPVSKIIATVGGTGLTGTAVWLNAEHVAATEGWHSPLVVAGIIITLCAASAPPFAERAAKSGQPLKAVALWTFFFLAVCFSLSVSIARSSGYVADKLANAEQANESARLAKEAYDAAKESQAAECVKRGNRCRAAEDAVTEARKALTKTAPVQSVDPGTERLAAVLGVDQRKVQLYVPLFLPLGLELGVFIFLAFGFAPHRREAEVQPIAMPAQEVASPSQVDANLLQDIANELKASAKPMQSHAKQTQAIATMMQAAAKPPAAGTRVYYLARLNREFPEIAKRVDDGKLSVFRGCIEAGIRKEPAKSAKWTKAEAYAASVKQDA
jgi:hypothetical protein